MSQDKWVWGMDFQSFNSDLEIYREPINVRMNAISFYSGYDYSLNDLWSVRPSLSVGFGVKNDNGQTAGVFGDILVTITGEITSTYTVSCALIYKLSHRSEIRLKPSLSKHKLVINTDGAGVIVEDDWEPGVGIGYGFQVNDKVGLTVSYDATDISDILSAGFFINF